MATLDFARLESELVIHDASMMTTPALVIFRSRVKSNLEQMIALAGDPSRLRPHVKTHKMPGVARLAASLGITKHKCATIAEAEMLARAGIPDVLLSYPLVGPNLTRWSRLRALYPATTFRATADHPAAAVALGDAVADLASRGKSQPTLVDLDVGMGRTGADPEQAFATYKAIADHPALVPDGIHAYDGHLRQSDPIERTTAVQNLTHAMVKDLRQRLEQAGLPVPRLVLGGTPTFPMHAAWNIPEAECSPGTCIFHDLSYAGSFPDLPFLIAAALVTRVVSQPRPGRLCLDLGYKAVASDPTPPRARIVGLEHATIGPQSEEHLVIDIDPAESHRYPPGHALLAVPAHICPTCALHRSAYVVEDGRVVEVWDVEARERFLTC